MEWQQQKEKKEGFTRVFVLIPHTFTYVFLSFV